MLAPSLRAATALLAVTGVLAAQSNAIPGADVSVYDVGFPNVQRTGPAYPNGTAGVAIGHSMANCGTVHLPWQGTNGTQLIDQHVKIAFLLARESDGRMVQISGKSFAKHSRIAFNFSGSGPCNPCQTGPSNHFRIGCYDIYSYGFNGNRSILGPTTEIDPWLGTWNPVGSYFDVGDPQQANYPQPADGVQSLNTTGFSPVKNLMEVPERELGAPGRFYAQNHVVIIGEPAANRANNQVSAEMTFAWAGSSWTGNLVGNVQFGSVLQRWQGATTSVAGNGADDGRFLVAVKVTGPTNGLWHYEYAVHNLDNHRGGAALRLPLCASARLLNVGFRDIDQNPLNDWQISRSGDELAFLASANNPLDWNTFYNFHFDSDAAPVAGTATIDQARLGAGALSVAVPTTTPSRLGVQYLGAGCGSPAPVLFGNGVPSSPNASFALELGAAPNAFAFVVFGAAASATPVGGCDVFLDQNLLLATRLVQADATGRHRYALPVPAGMLPFDVAAQAFAITSSGPMLGEFAASNGVLVRVAGSGCP